MSGIYKDFDKKNEVPKVKIPKFATGGICNDAIFPKLEVFSQIDEIVKDIREQKNNIMAMEFTKCIGELLKKNGVVPKMTEYTRNFETDNTFETRYGVSIDELDFSEHDKVFEDKIASLKKKNKDLESCFTQREQDSTDMIMELKQRIGELESENEGLKCSIDILTASKSKWIDKAVEWQQKCEKLESKETEICEKEPNTSDSAPSIEWYDNRHQSDCIEINRLNTTIDVLIHKVEYLRQFAGLE